MQLPERYESNATTCGKRLVLELTVENHPGVMSHVCGLFARRAFSMEGILCLPVGIKETSKIWIRLARNGHEEQVLKQLRKLADVREIRLHAADHQGFAQAEQYFIAN